MVDGLVQFVVVLCSCFMQFVVMLFVVCCSLFYQLCLQFTPFLVVFLWVFMCFLSSGVVLQLGGETENIDKGRILGASGDIWRVLYPTGKQTQTMISLRKAKTYVCFITLLMFFSVSTPRYLIFFFPELLSCRRHSRLGSGHRSCTSGLRRLAWPKNLARTGKTIRGSRWPPIPIGFGIGILIKRRKILGGAQDTDFNKGLIGRFVAKFLRRRNRGDQGHSNARMENQRKN